MTVIFQPIGGVLTGFTEPMGRKKALICVNIPYAIAWLLLYYSASLTMIYVAFALLGLGIGLMEAPIFTYIGEIWYLQFVPQLKKMSASYSNNRMTNYLFSASQVFVEC